MEMILNKMEKDDLNQTIRWWIVSLGEEVAWTHLNLLKEDSHLR
jgi:hypothetical protein